VSDDDDDDACDDDEGSGPALGPLGNAIVATVVGGLILMAITRVLIPRVTVRQVPPPQGQGQT
jgi:hypothetical protein